MNEQGINRQLLLTLDSHGNKDMNRNRRQQIDILCFNMLCCVFCVVMWTVCGVLCCVRCYLILDV